MRRLRSSLALSLTDPEARRLRLERILEIYRGQGIPGVLKTIVTGRANGQ